MRSDCGFADQRDTDTNRANEQRLPSSYSVEKEDNKDKVEEGTDNIIDASDEQGAVAFDPEVVVHNGRVVANDIDTREFG